jgi:metallo-beta-lactamase family protein
VAAEVVNVDAFSAHADAGELIHWMRDIRIPPGKLFLTHGEPSASSALKDRIKSELGWNSEVAEDMQEVLL